jgi:ATP phosphoribosyltransferase regulatory subunit
MKEGFFEAPGEAGRVRELPPGFRDLLPEAAFRLYGLRERLLRVLGLWGYQPVCPPFVEYAEVFTRALEDPAGEGSLYKLVDRATGHVLGLRPDFTPQIARMAATRFGEAARPLRLCYEGQVLRHVQAQKGKAPEIRQLGAECLGVASAEADAEGIALVIACLEEAGIEGFKVDVGQVELFKGVLHGTGLSQADASALTDCVARKDVSDLGRLLERLPLPDRKKRLLSELPLLAGGVEVLRRAEALVESDHSRRALENLARVVELVELYGVSESLTIDLGELRGVDYHTGVIFEAFVPHLGGALCKGGRYDRLARAYGEDLPATGFSIDLLAALEALHVQGSQAEEDARSGVFVIGTEACRGRALGLAARLRELGFRVARELLERPLEESLACAREQGFVWAVVAQSPGNEDDQTLLVEVGSGARHSLSGAELEAFLVRAGEEKR